MKKEYSKPDVFFEDFSLSTSIAAGCEETPDPFVGSGTVTCGVKWAAGIYVFTNAIYGCNRIMIDGQVDEGNNGLCYHNPSNNYNVFNS